VRITFKFDVGAYGRKKNKLLTVDTVGGRFNAAEVKVVIKWLLYYAKVQKLCSTNFGVKLDMDTACCEII